MKYKKPLTKIDILRWVAVLPITILIIVIYTTLVVDLFYKVFDILFNEEVVAHIVGITNMILIPILITACGYYIAPKFKFKSTLILVSFFLLLESISVSLRIYEHMHLNPYVSLALISHLIALYVVYKLENIKK